MTNHIERYYESPSSEVLGQRDLDGKGTGRGDLTLALKQREAVLAHGIAGIQSQSHTATVPGAPDGTNVSANIEGATDLATGPTSWDFKYLYYTESDQVLMVRTLKELYLHLNTYPRRMMLPHRLYLLLLLLLLLLLSH